MICDLVASTNNVFCVKISAEKTTFELETSDGKPIERVHDVRAYNISSFLYLGGGISPERRNVEAYFRDLLRSRLREFGFASTDIRDYLGDDLVEIDSIVEKLASETRGKPVYCGWQVTWQIADRTTRHLLEIISTIFDAAKVDPKKPASRVSSAIQSKQVLRFSEDKLRGLMFLPGTVEILGKKRGLGKVLYDCAVNFGKVSRYYLRSSSDARAEQSGKRRFDERLAIEIDNSLSLHSDAQRVLDQLVRFAVFDDEQTVMAFDDRTRKPLFIFNRVYCPILAISFRRDSHWRLSSRRFEEFLLDPTDFVRNDDRLRRFINPEKPKEDELFGS